MKSEMSFNYIHMRTYLCLLGRSLLLGYSPADIYKGELLGYWGISEH